MICVRVELTAWTVRAALFVARPIAAVVDAFVTHLRPLRAGYPHRRIQW